MIVLDTTILVYAKGSAHPLREPCRTLIRRIGEGSIRATTTVEVIQEFAHVRARRTDRAEAAIVALAYAELLAPLLMVTDVHLAAGLPLFVTNPRLGAFDAVLCATALDAGATALVSADAAFAMVPGLSYLDPISALEGLA